MDAVIAVIIAGLWCIGTCWLRIVEDNERKEAK